MNFTQSEAEAVGQTFAGQDTTGLQTLFTNSMFVVVQLEMFGDHSTDPFRKAWAFFNQTRATTFANALKSGAPRSLVVVYQGSTVVQQSGEVNLLSVWQGRSLAIWGQPLPNAHSNELADVAVATSTAKARAAVSIFDGGGGCRITPKRLKTS